jgi:N-acetyl-gamma-glutamyl-phosphate reductase
MKKIFVDGAHGTTGLKIFDRLKNHSGIEIIEIPEEVKKNPAEKEKRFRDADLVILCLPDEASKEVFASLKNEGIRIIDTSTAFRVDPEWIYGMPELEKNSRKKIKNAKWVSNPGCYPTGFLLALAPLVKSGAVPGEYPVSSYAITGYSGGGKKMISEFESYSRDRLIDVCCRPKNLDLKHKHLPEMKKYAHLKNYPHFVPIVGNFYNGMLVFLPLFPSLLSKKFNPDDIREILTESYKNETFVRVASKEESEVIGSGFISPADLNGTNRAEIFVTGHKDQILVISRLDNLGKGASGAAVQNMNIMLGFDELDGLS